MRIGNVIQPSPSHPFAQEILPYHQNNLAPYAPSPASPFAYPTASPYSNYPQQASIVSPTAAYPPPGIHGKPGFSIYNIAHHYGPKPTYYPTSPAYSQAQNPFPLQQSPIRSFYQFKGPSPYPYEQFGVVDKSSSYPFQRLNAGESLPQPNPLTNLNYGLAGEVYRPGRFVRNPSQNATRYHWLGETPENIESDSHFAFHAPRPLHSSTKHTLLPLSASTPMSPRCKLFVHPCNFSPSTTTSSSIRKLSYLHITRCIVMFISSSALLFSLLFSFYDSQGLQKHSAAHKRTNAVKMPWRRMDNLISLQNHHYLSFPFPRPLPNFTLSLYFSSCPDSLMCNQCKALSLSRAYHFSRLC